MKIHAERQVQDGVVKFNVRILPNAERLSKTGKLQIPTIAKEARLSSTVLNGQGNDMVWNA